MGTRLRRFCERPRAWGAAAFFLTVCLLLGHYAVKYGLNVAPSPAGDEFSYDSIGWNLAHGAGYAEGGDDPEFYLLYDQANAFDRQHVANRVNQKPERVAYRPPLFPVLLAGLNTVFGRQFWAVRTLNVLATAGTCGLLVWYLTKTHRSGVALIVFAMFLVVDTRTRLYGRAILTEATATFLTTAATVVLIHLGTRVQLKSVILLGIIVGMMVLDRTVFALWLPGLAVIVFVLSWRAPADPATNAGKHRWRNGLSMTLVFLTAAGFVVLPWAVRNVSVLGVMMPLGTQGMAQLPAGFSDLAVENRGVWDLEPSKQLEQLIDDKSMTRLERDVARAELGRTTAFRWIGEHPGTSIRLAGMKIWQEYRPRSWTEYLIGTSALVGLLLSLGRNDTRIFLTLHAVSCFSIGCTWSVEGRFVAPLVFSIHVLAAVALVAPFGVIRRRT
ncbi:MAG: phospholipid carrier-dependent glycosyltransferase [Planctomycetaceae bacterium]